MMGAASSTGKLRTSPSTVVPINRQVWKEWSEWHTAIEVWKWKDRPHGADHTDFIAWEFDIWNGLNNNDFVTLSMLIFQRFNLHTTFNIDATHWYQFIFEVERLMTTNLNPYHNYTHIMDVFQTCAVILTQFDGAIYLSELDIFSLLLASILHDLEHPGLNNAYQVNAFSPLAIRYNDIAVLESYHCARAYELLADLNMNILTGLTFDQKKYMRKTIISLILSTDMAAHFALKDELEAMAARTMAASTAAKAAAAASATDSTSTAAPPTVELNDKDKLTLLKSILHVADISNPAKPWITSRKWSDLVLEEFFQQGDKEKAESLPVSMNCDRNTTQQDELSVNFADFIVAPFFMAITKLLPKMIKCCHQLEANRLTWHQMVVERLTSTIDPEKAEEIVSRWEKRSVDFGEKMRSLEVLVGTAPSVVAATAPGSS